MTKSVARSIIHLYKVIFLIFAPIAVHGAPTLEEKIGQLFIVPACQLRGEDHLEDLEKLVRQGRVGGILLKQGTVQGQRALIDRLQKISPLPLICLQDGEWGLAMHLSDVIPFPKNMTLGAVQDLSLLYQLGVEMGRQCRIAGIHVNLAPCIDVNSNPLNPIIHMRSFGEDPLQVAIRAEMVMRGMQSQGIIACAKHFPGHGDTSVDSHIGLPYVNHDLEQLEKVELFPFSWLIQSGVKAIMSGHLCAPALDPSLPATFSHSLITALLQNKMGFKGLILSDALNMKALHDTPGETATRALLAGHDFLLYGDHIAPNIDQILRFDVPAAFEALKTAVENKEISEKLIDDRFCKIVQLKKELGLLEQQPSNEIPADINSPSAHALKKRLFQEAITLVRNDQILPLKEGRIAMIEWGSSPFFTALIAEELETEVFSLDDPQLFTKLERFSSAILTLSKTFPFEKAVLSPIPLTAVVFGTPYSLGTLPPCQAILVAYENEREAQEAAAAVVLGRLGPKGRLPIVIDY